MCVCVLQSCSEGGELIKKVAIETPKTKRMKKKKEEKPSSSKWLLVRLWAGGKAQKFGCLNKRERERDDVKLDEKCRW